MNTVFEHNFADNRTTIVVHNATNRNTAVLFGAVSRNLDYITTIANKDMITGNRRFFFSQFGVVHQHMELAMNRHVVRWIERVDQLDMVVVVAMPRKVKWPNTGQVCFAVLNHVRAFTHQTIDRSHDIFFVTWDRVRAEHDNI